MFSFCLEFRRPSTTKGLKNVLIITLMCKTSVLLFAKFDRTCETKKITTIINCIHPSLTEKNWTPFLTLYRKVLADNYRSLKWSCIHKFDFLCFSCDNKIRFIFSGSKDILCSYLKITNHEITR